MVFFDDVVGQSSIKENLIKMGMEGEIPHCLLLHGRSGYGPLCMALAFAQLLQCRNKSKGEACGKCKACIQSGHFVHPDIHFTFPTIGAKVQSPQFYEKWREFISTTEGRYSDVSQWLTSIDGANRQGNISRDECERLISTLQLRAYEGQYKISLIWMAEYLGKQANRLLKIMEDPPGDTVFILIVEDMKMVLPTVLSRCRIIPLPPLDVKDIAGWLKEQRSISPARAEEVALISEGDLNAAIGYVQTEGSEESAQFLDWLRLAYRGGGVHMVKWSENFGKRNREVQKQFYRYGLHFVRQLIRGQTLGEASIILPQQEKSAAIKLLDLITEENTYWLAEQLNKDYYYIERNALSRLTLLDTMIALNDRFRAGVQV